jgi:hypothetical protein
MRWPARWSRRKLPNHREDMQLEGPQHVVMALLFFVQYAPCHCRNSVTCSAKGPSDIGTLGG